MDTRPDYNANQIEEDQSISDKHLCFPAVSEEYFRLHEDGLSPQKSESTWKQISHNLISHQNNFLGFQANQSLDCDKIKPFFDISINNGGDPFSAPGQSAMNTKPMERAVMDYFAKLWNIHESSSLFDKEREYWGYVTSMGCTEANLLALYNARDYLAGMPLICPKVDPNIIKVSVRQKENADQTQSIDQLIPNIALKDNPNALTPVVFFSEGSYHGHVQALRMLQMKTFCDIGSGNFPCPLKYPDDFPSNFNETFLDQNGWPRAVPVDADGSINILCLVKLVTAFVSRGYPPLVIFTTGTTFKGAYDNPQAAISELVPILKQHNMYERRVYQGFSEDTMIFDTRSGFWFHIDSALSGAYLPFLEMAINQGLLKNMFPNGFPVFDFRISEVKSIAMSVHKWFGCPFPAAIFMIRKMDQVKPPYNPLYIGGLNNTLSGSRNGHSVLVLWDLI